MELDDNEVWITGLGLVSSVGEGVEEHWQKLGPGAFVEPVIEQAAFSPYPVHPLIELDFSKQIPGRSDLRQMGKWQKLGTYTAGMALDDAGVSGNQVLLEKTNMIVAAGGGERDLAVDTALLEVAGNPKDSEEARNHILMNDLRPTHFLAELSNLLAGNISIVHGVTGSSRTFMGEEMAGFSAVEIAAKRIKNQQGELFLVGGAFNAEREDMLLQLDLGQILWAEAFEPLWARQAKGGGMVLGSVSAFLVLESKQHALARGKKPYARLSGIASGRSTRTVPEASDTAEKYLKALGGNLADKILPVLSGASGVETPTRHELKFVETLQDQGYEVALRGYGNVLGHSVEAQFPAGLVLACLAASKDRFYEPFEASDLERSAADHADRIIVTTWAPFHGEGMALVEKVA